MRAPKKLRYTVDGSDKSYEAIGPALSLSITLAARDMSDGLLNTYYVRDSITGEPVGYSETVEIGGSICVTTEARKSRS